MIVLVTGHRGRLGAAIADALTSGGYEVRGFDLADGGDVLDSEAVRRAAQGVTSIVHIAGIAGDRPARPADIMAVNLLGTWNVLLAAEAAGIGRVVYFSSGKALGMLERDPDYLPIDDAHRGLPSLPYALSKWLAEEMCAAFTARSGIDTLCLRPVQAFDERSYAIAMAGPAWTPGAKGCWPLGVHVDIRDVAVGARAALECEARGHHRMLLAGVDIASRQPTLELVASILPAVPWRGGEEYVRDPYRSLVDCTHARQILGWSPRHAWPGRTSDVARNVAAK
ncbi:MAG: NAD-dependent epimerase/dehydratase family protein [Steroidobacteraceae bacterium]